MDDQEQADMDVRIAGHIAAYRKKRGLSLDLLAERAGVSRAMISKIERMEVRPTAVLLAKLANAFGVSLSTLFKEESQGDTLVRAATRPVWIDPATGYSRRNVGPASASVDVVDVTLPAGQTVSHDNATPLNMSQIIWVLEGQLTMIVDGAIHHLRQGDSLQMKLDRPLSFRNETALPVRYAVVLIKGVA